MQNDTESYAALRRLVIMAVTGGVIIGLTVILGGLYYVFVDGSTGIAIKAWIMFAGGLGVGTLIPYKAWRAGNAVRRGLRR